MFCCLAAEASEGVVEAGKLESIARACSPRVAPYGERAVVCDVSGLMRACGPPPVIAAEVHRLAADQGLAVRVAVADTMTGAWILAHARDGVTVACGAGRTQEALAALPISWLGTVLELDRVRARAERDGVVRGPASRQVSSARPRRPRHFRNAPPPAAVVPATIHSRSVWAVDREQRNVWLDRLATLERWGIRTCGALAALPRADIHARMGPLGVRLHQAACGEDVAPLVSVAEAPVFTDEVVLDWPIEGLEPLTFVLAQQCERLSRQLEHADRGAVAIHTTLTLVTHETHARSVTMPTPLRDARVLRTLIALDLETHPPAAAIDAVRLQLDVTPGRILQGSLLTWAAPTPEDLSTLLARLGALVGSTRVGAPVCPDTHDLRMVMQHPFTVAAVPIRQAPVRSPVTLTSALRRLRLPMAARVTLVHGHPVEVWPSARGMAGGRVVRYAGPWRTSGWWWLTASGGPDDDAVRSRAWDRDEWDVEVNNGVVYRLARQRQTGGWEIEGVFD